MVFGYLKHLFLTPSAYLHNWRGFLANQAGHAAIGLVLAHFIGWVALAVYFGWEWAQYRYSRGKSLWRHNGPMRVGSTVSDGIGDWAFVSTGVFAVMIHPAILALTVMLLIEGALERAGR